MTARPQCPGRPQYVGLIARVFQGGSQPLHLDWDDFELARWPLNPSTPTPTNTATPTATPNADRHPLPLPTIAPPGGPVTITYHYDSLYRLTGASYSDGRSYHYTYDAVGNRLAQQSMVNTLPSAVAYAYDDANRLLGVSTGSTVYDPLTAARLALFVMPIVYYARYLRMLSGWGSSQPIQRAMLMFRWKMKLTRK